MSGKKGKKTQQKEKAKRLIHQTMIALKEEFPALIYAINLLNKKNKWKELELKESISTDGENLFYCSEKVIRECWNGDLEELKKQILHIVLHGLLGHFDMHEKYRDEKLLWVSMDREVEYIVQNLFPKQIEDEWEDDDYYDDEDNDYRSTMRAMDEYLGDNYGIQCYYRGRNNKVIRKKMLSDGEYIRRDNHEMWSQYRKKQASDLGNAQTNAQGTSEEEENRKQAIISSMWKQAAEVVLKEASVSGINSVVNQLQKKEAYGTGSGNSILHVMAEEENENSYYNIIMDFLTIKDTAKEQQDEIDTMLYSYGLEMYGDIPLVEPPEETEQLDIHTICLAIDTSGSCSGAMARKFLRESYNIIRDLSTVSQGGELYVFQCDNELQEERYYSSIQEVEIEEWENMHLKGYGGTSFIPVFKRIEEIKKEEHTIDCLVYLTDGAGDYPNEKPDYPVYFLMTEYDYECILNRRNSNFYRDWVRFIKFEE